MLKLYVGDELLDLPDNIRIRISRSNPAYLGKDVGVIKGGFSYPFDLPMTGRNRALLGHPNRPDSAERLPEDLPAKLYVGPDLLMVGRITVLRAGNTSARTIFFNNPLADLSKVKMSDANIGGYSYATAAALQANMRDTTVNPIDRPWLSFPLYNTTLNPGSLGDADDDQFQNAYNPTSGNFRQDLPISLFLRAEFLLRALMESQGYVWQDLFHVTDEHKRITLVNNRPLNVPGGSLALAADYNTLLPDTTIAEFLKDYCRIFGLAPFASLTGEQITLQPLDSIIGLAEGRNWTDYASHETGREAGGKLKRLGFAAQDQFYPGLGTWKDLGTPDVVRAGFFSEADPAQTDTLYYIEARNCYGKYYEQPGGGLLFRQTFSTGSINNARGEEELTTNLQPVQSNQLFFYPQGTDNLIVPFWSQDLAEPLTSNEVGGSTVAHALAIYRGLQNTSNNILFPLAGVNNYNVDLSRIDGEELTLRWLGSRGLYDNHWQAWDEMLQQADVIPRTFLLPLTELLAFDFREKVRVGNRNYFVRDMEFSVGNSGVSATECTLVAVS